MILSRCNPINIYILFSDIHYAAHKPVNSGNIIGRKLTQYALPLVENLIDEINKINPDMVINLGDLIEDSGDKSTDLKDLKTTWERLKRINAPFYSVIGNHDLRAMDSRKEIEEIIGYENATFSIDLNGYHFIFLSPEVNNKVGTAAGGILRTQFLNDKDMGWLEQDLMNNNLPCIVLCHFGLAEDDMKGNWWFCNNPETAVWANRNEIKKILKQDENLIAVFSGHQHWTKSLKEDGIDYHIIGSMTEDINENGIPDGIYFEVDLTDKNLKITKHNIRL